MFEFKINIATLLISFFTAAFMTWIINLRKKRPKIIALEPDEGVWFNIETNPLPNEYIEVTSLGILNQEILVTDGEKVDLSYHLHYNKDGKPCMSSYSGRVITHWRPKPRPPQ